MKNRNCNIAVCEISDVGYIAVCQGSKDRYLAVCQGSKERYIAVCKGSKERYIAVWEISEAVFWRLYSRIYVEIPQYSVKIHRNIVTRPAT